MTRSPLRAAAVLAGAALAAAAARSAPAAAPGAAAAAIAPGAAPAAPIATPALALAPSPVTALVLDGKDLRQSTLIGPSGQVYEPTSPAAAAAATSAATAARWVRRSAGGVSSSVAGAFLLDGQLFAAGASTPLFRRRHNQWQIVHLGQRGRVAFGSGPFFSLAVGRQIFISKEGRFLRTATAPGAVLALWSASETAMLVATDQGVFRRRGNAFSPVGGKLPGVVAFSGAAPHALTAELAINLKTNARVRLPGQLVRAVRSESTPSAIVRTPAGALALARDLTSASSSLALPSPAVPSLAAVDAAGRAVLVSSEGVRVYDGVAWLPTALADELPAPRNGPSPARSR